jgi:signal transduction histidine kinase
VIDKLLWKMGRSSNPNPRGRARISKPILGAGISAGAAILIAALLHANALAVGTYIDDSAELARTEAALVATQLSLRTLSQAVLVAEDVSLGVADPATAATAAAEAARVTADLESRLEGLHIDQSVAQLALSRSNEILAGLANDVRAAGDLLAGDGLDAYEQLRDAVVVSRDGALAKLTNAQGMARRIGTIAGFVIALLAPALAIFAYWRIARRQLDSARVEMNSRVRAERRIIQAKDEFISNISHELRTPLTSIYGFSEILVEQGLIDPKEAQTLISVINEESAELNRMVEDLLTVARAEAGTIAYNFAGLDLAEELATVVRPLQRAGMAIEVACPPLRIQADQLRTRQVLRNLLSNAHRWGGDEVYVTAHQTGATAVVTVADNGPGVAPDMEHKLFTRYMHEGDTALTTGTIGLGLAASRILLDGMGGEIHYERDDGWTRFIVYLPMAAATESPAPAQSRSEERSIEVA